MAKTICLDTNAWFSESLLRSSVGAAVLYALSTRDDRILLPEIVERELAGVVTRHCRVLLHNIDDARRRIKELTGRHAGVDGPIEDANIRDSVRDRFAQLGEMVVRQPTPEPAYKRAFDRLIEARPPNFDKNQQAKDSLLWECILSLGADAEVVLVSADKGFYENRDSKSGVASELLDEATEKLGSFQLVASCSELLKLIPTAHPRVDEAVVSRALENVLPPFMDVVVSRIAPKDALLSWENERQRLDLYLTANPNEITVVFRLWASLVTREEPEPHKLFVEGRTTYFIDGATCASPTYEFIKTLTRGIHMASSRAGMDEFLGSARRDSQQNRPLLIPLGRVQAVLDPDGRGD